MEKLNLNARRLDPLRAYLAAFFAFFLFGCTSLVVKPSSLAIVQLVWGRMAITAGCALVFLLMWRRPLAGITKKSLAAAAATSTAIFLNLVCLFESFRLAPISLCVTLFYAGPLLTLVLRRWLDRTRFLRVDGVAIFLVVIALVGLGLESNPAAPRDTDVIRGYCFALAGGGLFGLIPIFERHCVGLSPVLSLFIQSFWATLCLLPFASVSTITLGGSEGVGLIVLGVLFTFVPFLLWWVATRNSQSLSPFVVYIDPATAALISLVVFAQGLTSVQAGAMSLMVAAAILHVWFSRSHLEVRSSVEVA